jgi:pyrroline-5-carboxylate reductase
MLGRRTSCSNRTEPTMTETPSSTVTLGALKPNGPIVLVGCGNMGGALLRGWLDGGLSPDNVIVQDPSPPPAMAGMLKETGVRHIETPAALDAGRHASVLIMAVKPQIMAAVYADAVSLIGPDTVVLSIAAGRTIASFEAPAPAGTAVVRTIPNTPSAIGRGITICYANEATQDAHRALCNALLTALGEVGWVDREDLIDAATAISGSGPAYIFHMAECLAAAARDLGLPDDLAAQMANATVSGAGELIRRADVPPSTLRENVTSPNGTTQAALDVLMADPGGLKALMQTATKAAYDRSRELAG